MNSALISEVAVETAIILVMAIAAHILGYALVRLVEAPIREDEHFLVEPPHRKARCVSEARKLRRRFARKNAYADFESETLIVLPATTTRWIIGATVAFVTMILLTNNHFYGAVQIFIAPADHDIFYDVMAALMGFSFISVFIGVWVSDVVMPNASIAKATRMAETRLRKGRTARFAQALSLDEIAIVARWAVQEERLERRVRKNGRRNQKQLRAEIVQFPNQRRAG